jgi:hypothetical protein
MTESGIALRLPNPKKFIRDDLSDFVAVYPILLQKAQLYKQIVCHFFAPSCSSGGSVYPVLSINLKAAVGAFFRSLSSLSAIHLPGVLSLSDSKRLVRVTAVFRFNRTGFQPPEKKAKIVSLQGSSENSGFANLAGDQVLLFQGFTVSAF